ncbi:MAG: hypothetical protein P8X43_15225, partial [Maritimibacter sp.]
LAIIPTKSCCALRSHMIAGVVDSVEAYSWEKSSGEVKLHDRSGSKMMPAKRVRSPAINSGEILRPAIAVAAGEAPHIVTAARAAMSATVFD